MPKLPSGFMIGIAGMKHQEMLKHFLAMNPQQRLLTIGAELAIHTSDIDSIKPFVRVMYYRQCEGVARYKHDARSNQPPEDMEPYDSGFTLADYPGFASEWPEEDKTFFYEFLKSEKVTSYLKDVLQQAQDAGNQYQENLLNLLVRVGGDDTTDDGEMNWDDYDLNSAVFLFALLPEPEEKNKLDLWMRMHAMRWNTLPMLMGTGNKFSSDMPRSFSALSGELRAFGNLEKTPSKEREWLHKQQVVFANDLFDLYEPDDLTVIDPTAYQVIKHFALTEPTR